MEAIIHAAGGVNAARGWSAVSQIDDRAILDMQPDIVIFTHSWTRQDIELWSRSSVYADIPAVMHHRLYQMPFVISADRVKNNPMPYIEQIQAWLSVG